MGYQPSKVLLKNCFQIMSMIIYLKVYNCLKKIDFSFKYSNKSCKKIDQTIFSFSFILLSVETVKLTNSLLPVHNNYIWFSGLVDLFEYQSQEILCFSFFTTDFTRVRKSSRFNQKKGLEFKLKKRCAKYVELQI